MSQNQHDGLMQNSFKFWILFNERILLDLPPTPFSVDHSSHRCLDKSKLVFWLPKFRDNMLNQFLLDSSTLNGTLNEQRTVWEYLSHGNNQIVNKSRRCAIDSNCNTIPARISNWTTLFQRIATHYIHPILRAKGEPCWCLYFAFLQQFHVCLKLRRTN